MDRSEIEEIFLQFLMNLTDDEKRNINFTQDVYNHINCDVEEEIKDELYRRVLNLINWRLLIEKMKEDLPEESDDERESIVETIYSVDSV